jgi:hypothetical protein
MSTEERRYISYLVRFWQTRRTGEPVWRASVESPHTGERRGFASTTDLFTFLEEEIRGVAGNQLPPDAGEKKGGNRK